MVEPVLGDELLTQVQRFSGVDLYEESTSTSIKFDDKGSLHLMKRDSDGKLLNDIPIKDIKYEPSYKDEVQRDYEQMKVISKNKKNYTSLIIYGTLGFISIGMILSIVMLSLWLR